jgi:type II secretory pathway component PulM
VPLFDKVKAQATQVAQKAQEAGRAGAARLEDAQAKRQLDSLLHDLGVAVYAERKGTSGDSTQVDIDALCSQIDRLEAEHGLLFARDVSADPAPTPPEADTAAAEEGHYTL